MKVPAQSQQITRPNAAPVVDRAPALVEAERPAIDTALVEGGFAGTVSSSTDDNLKNFIAEQGNGTPAEAKARSTTKASPRAEISPAQRQAMRDQFEASREGLRWSREESVLPLGVKFDRVPLGHEGGADGYTFTALVPSGALVPGSVPPTSADEGSRFFVERSGGLAGTTRVAGPIALAD